MRDCTITVPLSSVLCNKSINLRTRSKIRTARPPQAREKHYGDRTTCSLTYVPQRLGSLLERCTHVSAPLVYPPPAIMCLHPWCTHHLPSTWHLSLANPTNIMYNPHIKIAPRGFSSTHLPVAAHVTQCVIVAHSQPIARRSMPRTP